jgi:hypothetical protein
MEKINKGLKILATILLTGSFWNNYIKAQENISSIASISTSYVSSWETLSAINDGFVPTSSTDHSHGAYGNWKSGVTNQWNWVEYDFPSLYKLFRSDVYWWTDQTDITLSSGVQMPYDCYIQYWDFIHQTWKEVKNPVGYGVTKDTFNVTTFDTILTNKIRLNFVSLSAQGIIEWKVFGSLGEQVPIKSRIEIDTPLALNDTSLITLTALDKDSLPVIGYIFKFDATIKNNSSVTSESYSINNQSFTTSSSNISLPATDVQGKVSFNIAIPATVDPKDGLDLKVTFNDGFTAVDEYSIYKPGLTPPALTADVSSNNVDNPIEITFTDNASWRNSIEKVYANGILLNSPDYETVAGILTLKPSSGDTVLTKVGIKLITVEATGYNTDSIAQTITTGAISATASSVNSELKLYKSSTTPVTVTASDQFGNPIKGYIFKWDASVTNNTSATNESYTVNGVNVAANITGQSLVSTDSTGTVTFRVIVPASVDLSDGLQIQIKLNDGSTNVGSAISYVAQVGEKGIYIPTDLKSHEWSYDKTAQSDNFILFWGDLIGADPKNPANGSTTIDFDAADILKKLEKYYALYIDSFKFIPNKDEGNIAKYKFDIIITDTWNNSGYANGWATGGSVDGVIGAMWINPNATSGSGFTLAHEFTHCCQAMVPVQYPGKGIKDSNTAVFSMFWESHANFMALTATGDMSGVNAERWVNTAMMHFSSYRHAYQNIYFLQYIYDKYGMTEINNIWLNAEAGEHPLMSFKNNMGFTQDQLNDEFGYYAMKNATWDYSIHKKIKDYLSEEGYAYVCREFTVLDSLKGNPNTYIVPRQLAPGDYGYNIIPVYPDAGSSQIIVNFSGYDNANAGGAGWRYGFVAVDKTGTRRYSSLSSAQTGTASFDITSADSAIYLVVTGAPQVHHNYANWEPGWPKIYRYPYKLKITGATPEGYLPGYNSQKSTYPGAAHSNGGGWVASTATVASTAYVGPNAQVLGKATVTGTAKIEDYAIVTDNAVISGNAVIKGHAIVGSVATVSDNGVVEKSARVYLQSKIYGDALITGSAIVQSSEVYGTAIVKDLAWIYGATLSGTIIAGGDAEDLTTCSAGTYLQGVLVRSCDKKNISKYNIDINPDIKDYTYPIGEIPTSPLNLIATNINSTSVDLSWDAASDDAQIATYWLISGTNAFGSSSTTSLTVSGLTPNTTYTTFAKAIDNSGNESDSSNSVTFKTLDTTTAIGVKTINTGYRLYPNPAKEAVTIEFNGTANVILFDNLGRSVYKTSFTDKITIAKELIGPQGVYCIQISSGKQIIIHDKLIVQ